MLIGSLLQQAQHWQVDVSDAASGITTVQLRIDLTSANLAAALHAAPTPQALAAWIGLAAI